VLEAFAGMPEYELTVCGPVKQEKRLETAYAQELYRTRNLHTIGWVKLDSPEFVAIANRCIAAVYASCSEGGGGSIITCMHAGLIPIVTHEASVDVDPSFGWKLQDASIEEIRNAVRAMASMPAADLRAMSRRAWEFARANHTRENFAAQYRNVIRQILADHRSSQISAEIAETVKA
jgi:glycosyltransferase involved in cell wall biosynthesis